MTTVKGIPDFRLQLLRNFTLLSEMLYDVPILEHLNDAKTICKDKITSFILVFHFVSDEFFIITVLKEEYEMKYEDDLFSSKRKKPKHKSRGKIRTVKRFIIQFLQSLNNSRRYKRG